MKISKKVLDRLASGIKQFKPIAEQHKARDVSEADTVTLVKDMLSICFGYDKYTELTSEQQIRGQFCDLAVKIDDKIKYLIEVKSAATGLNATHIRQVVTYGANSGIKWVILTNSIEWHLFKITLDKTVNSEPVTSINIFDLDHKNSGDMQKLFLLCREGITQDAIDVFHQKSRLLNKYTISQVIMGDAIVSSVRRELRKLFPNLKISNEALLETIQGDIFKRELVDSDEAKSSSKLIKRAELKLSKQKIVGVDELISELSATEFDSEDLPIVQNNELNTTEK